jgi:hypothetical protein
MTPSEGIPRRGSLFNRTVRAVLVAVVSLTLAPLAASATPPVAAADRTAVATYPLAIKVVGVDGQPLRSGLVDVFAVDDVRKYSREQAQVTDGTLRLSVPKGTYAVFGNDVSYDPVERRKTGRTAWVSDIAVKTFGGTATLDYRTATAEPKVVVPRPAIQKERQDVYVWVDARGKVANWQRVDAEETQFFRPIAPKLGKLESAHFWRLAEDAPVSSYVYWVGGFDPKLRTKPVYTFGAGQLATVNANYYGDGRRHQTAYVGRALDLRSAGSVSDGGSYLQDYTQPEGTQRTEYLGMLGTGKATPLWSAQAGPALTEDGFVHQGARPYPPGTTITENWFKGPWASGIPSQAVTDRPNCLAFRTNNELDIDLSAYTEADRRHRSPGGGSDGKLSWVRLYEGAKLLAKSDGNMSVYGTTRSTGKSNFRVQAQFDRSGGGTPLSTSSTTRYTFRSAPDTGPVPPKGWNCNGEARMLPLLQADLNLPVALTDGSLPAAKSKVTLTLKRIQGAGTATIKSARLEVRPVGDPTWTVIDLQPAARAGRYEGTIDNSAWAGKFVDVRYGGSDTSGGTFLQDVVRAYVVRA